VKVKALLCVKALAITADVADINSVNAAVEKSTKRIWRY
jgi:hypothetical protein